MSRWSRSVFLAISIVVLGSGYMLSGAQQEEVSEEPIRPAVMSSDCSFLQNPNAFVYDKENAYMVRSDQTQRVSVYRYGVTTTISALDPAAVPRKNFIDSAIFDRMAAAGIPSAAIASDAEFLRRVMVDLTGRIPSATDVELFLADTNPNKRDAKIDALVGSPEWVAKWTMFFGDLLRNNANATNVNRFTEGRDAFYLYIKDAVSTNKPYDLLAREVIAATGDSFVAGQTNWLVGTITPMVQTQDRYDTAAVQLATIFMGINTVDCLLCHNGARHTDSVSLWATGQTRQNMWGLSAYFARSTINRQTISPIPNLLVKSIVGDNNNGVYSLNTSTGNRSPRQPTNGLSTITPRYPFAPASANPFGAGSGIQTGETYRQSVARQVTADIQFARAAVNYIWEQFMVEPFVPSTSFDLDRLDPLHPPAAPWTLQPTNPELLDALARWFQQNNYDVRALAKLITKSSAYQLSSAYPGTWNIAYVPYYARKYVRRFSSEEIHDSIVIAAGVPTNYTFANLPPVQWAMQLPDTKEPVRAPAIVTFLNAFNRGDRDLLPRRPDGTVSQALAMMNNTFITSRIHQANAGSTVATLLSQTPPLDAATIIRRLFLSTLSRQPTDAEIAFFTPNFQQQGTRVAAEGLQWILLNKLDFIFNY